MSDIHKPVEVSKEEFFKFINNYPRKLEKDINGIYEPPLITYNDFTLGNWPESVIASTMAPDERLKEPPKFYINPHKVSNEPR